MRWKIVYLSTRFHRAPGSVSPEHQYFETKLAARKYCRKYNRKYRPWNQQWMAYVVPNPSNQED